MAVLDRLYALNLLLKSWDILTTTIAISMVGSSHIEANPVVKFSIDQFGLAPAMLLNFVLFFTMTSLIHYKKGITTMIIITALLAAVVTNNVIGLFILNK